MSGDEIAFNISVENVGDSSARNVRVYEVLLPGVFDYISSTASKGSYESGSGEWNVGDSSSGEVEILVIHVRCSQLGDFTNTFQIVDGELEDINPHNNSDSVSGKVVGGDPELVCSVDDGCPYEGEDVSFRFSIINNGPGPSNLIDVRTNIPEGFSIISYSGDGNFNEVSREWEVENLSNGDVANLVVICREEEEINNHVECFNPEIYHVEPTDINPENNNCELCVNMGKKSNSDIYIEGNVLNKLAAMGEEVEMDFVVGNKGIDPVYNVYGGIFIDGGVNFIGYGGSGIVDVIYPYFRIEKIYVGEEVHFWVKVIPTDLMEYHGEVYLDSELINDPDTSNNMDILRFSTRGIYRWIPGGKVNNSGGITLDFNGDGKVNVVDLYKLANIVVGNISPGSNAAGIYDLNSVGKIDGIDILIMRQYLTSKIY